MNRERYCFHCGAKYEKILYNTYFDSDTGDRILVYASVCPNRIKTPWWSLIEKIRHDKYDYKYWGVDRTIATFTKIDMEYRKEKLCESR